MTSPAQNNGMTTGTDAMTDTTKPFLTTTYRGARIAVSVGEQVSWGVESGLPRPFKLDVHLSGPGEDDPFASHFTCEPRHKSGLMPAHVLAMLLVGAGLLLWGLVGILPFDAGIAAALPPGLVAVLPPNFETVFVAVVLGAILMLTCGGLGGSSAYWEWPSHLRAAETEKAHLRRALAQAYRRIDEIHAELDRPRLRQEAAQRFQAVSAELGDLPGQETA